MLLSNFFMNAFENTHQTLDSKSIDATGLIVTAQVDGLFCRNLTHNYFQSKFYDVHLIIKVHVKMQSLDVRLY